MYVTNKLASFGITAGRQSEAVITVFLVIYAIFFFAQRKIEINVPNLIVFMQLFLNYILVIGSYVYDGIQLYEFD